MGRPVGEYGEQINLGMELFEDTSRPILTSLAQLRGGRFNRLCLHAEHAQSSQESACEETPDSAIVHILMYPLMLCHIGPFVGNDGMYNYIPKFES